MTRLYLSPPHMDGDERERLLAAFDSNWITPLGPEVDGFEAELAARSGRSHGAALSSGTAALHLALILTGVGADDEVVVPTLTFAATANAVTYVGAAPVFIDSEFATWNLDPDLLGEFLAARATQGRLPAAVVSVDLYGQCADYDRIVPVCEQYGVPLIVDAAEALGATWGGQPAGSFGVFGVFSFNGNKIITSGGGGMLTGDDGDAIARARNLASQAREPAPHYEHTTIGYNYRLSNVLAAIGRGQLADLDRKVARRRAINAMYRDALGGVDGVAFMPWHPRGEPNGWLTVLRIDPAAFGADREQARLHLESLEIEARPAWKPMHLQPVFAEATAVGGSVSETIFDEGLCLPSGSAMTDDDVERVVDALLNSRG